MAPERHLAAILSADVAGYSRLMAEDEQGTIQTITAYRSLVSSLVGDHHGRVVDSPGDNLLAEFPNALDAVQCAVEVQRVLQVRNQSLAENRQMLFRIGVHLGDITTEGDRIYGDAVNVAARLEGLAEPGGICISAGVLGQVETKLDLVFDDLGKQEVKNILKPVRVYRVMADPASAIPTSGEPALELPDEPSIAVLPFTNMSGDPEQEYFSDGITEDLITDLSKVPGLFVIARNSSFTYKGRPLQVQQVALDLGVRYVLEGSVRKAGDRVRITAQLVDASDGHHLWAERYDRNLDDIFAVQDEVTAQIVAALELSLTESSRTRVEKIPTGSLQAYDYFLRGESYRWNVTKETNRRAREMYEQAIGLDPGYAQAYAALSWVYFINWEWQWAEDPDAFDRSFELARRAVELDPSLPFAHAQLGWVYFFRNEHDRGIAELERALALDSNYAEAHANLAGLLGMAGRPAEAMRAAEKSMRLDPKHPGAYELHLAIAYHAMGQHEAAVGPLREALARSPDLSPAHRLLAVVYAELGREEEARAEVGEILRISPDASLDAFRRSLPYKDPEELERYIAALRKAGLPE